MPNSPSPAESAGEETFLDTLQRDTFAWFWETANYENGLIPDRAPNPPFSSVAAIGFGLTAYPVGVERGFVSRAEAVDRVLATLSFLWNAPQGPEPSGTTGYRGFYYHFLEMESGHRFRTVELSTIDTALLMAGVLFAQSYFTGQDERETAIRAYADSLYRRVEWDWMQLPSGLVSMGWRPEGGRFDFGYEGYDEAMILYVLALGSPTHPIRSSAWDAFTSTYVWGSFYGYEHVNFSPLFGHQFSHVWIDPRGLQDAFLREKGIDYFENSRRATLSQQQYAIDNPMGWAGYGRDVWGLTASDGPANDSFAVNGKRVQFFTYRARGASLLHIVDDGTIAPTATGGSIPFAPEQTIGVLRTIRERYGDLVYNCYGFIDAFNPTFVFQDADIERGTVDPDRGWFDSDQLGIDQGPILLMAENYRSQLIWNLMRENPHIVRGLCQAGFTADWLEGECNAEPESEEIPGNEP